MLESKLRWQCRRGVRELDNLFHKYLDCSYDRSSQKDKLLFHKLLDCSNSELISCFFYDDSSGDSELDGIIQKIKK